MSLSLITTIANQDLSSVTKRSKQPLRASYLAASIIKNHQHVETSKILRITYPSVESRRWTLTLPLTCTFPLASSPCSQQPPSTSSGIAFIFHPATNKLFTSKPIHPSPLCMAREKDFYQISQSDQSSRRIHHLSTTSHHRRQK